MRRNDGGKRQRRQQMRRRRRFFGGLLLLAAGLMIMGFARTPAPAAGREGETRPRKDACWEAYIVRPGDTLWTLAAERLQGDPRRGIEQIRERNGLAGAGLYPGQKLKLPGCRAIDGSAGTGTAAAPPGRSGLPTSRA